MLGITKVEDRLPSDGTDLTVLLDEVGRKPDEE